MGETCCKNSSKQSKSGSDGAGKRFHPSAVRRRSGLLEQKLIKPHEDICVKQNNTDQDTRVQQRAGNQEQMD